MKGVMLWLFQRVTGVILIAGLAVHFGVMHFSGSQQISHEFVFRRISSPYWKTFDLVFLSSVIFHGVSGLWGLALEYVSSPALLRFSKGVMLSSALVLMLTGVYIVMLR